MISCLALGLDPACTACTDKKCSCSSLKTFTGLEILISLYEQQMSVISSENTEEREAEAAFLRGHLAVLFGLLMMDDKDNQMAILDALPGSSSSAGAKRVKLAKLVEQASDFVVFYTIISRRLSFDRVVDVDGSEEKVKDNGVVKEVVSFLEGLRDGVS